MIEQNKASVEIKIGTIQAEQNMTQNAKKQQISELRKSLVVEQGTDSSFKVITSIANTMIGSSIIVYPIIFIKEGMLGSLIVLLVIGAALFFTCRLLVLHNRQDQIDFGVSIKRILGPKWAKLNSYVNISLIYIVSIVYFMLICGNFYDISSSIAVQAVDGYKPPPAKSIDLSKYSQQYASIISILFTAPLILKKDIDLLMKFFKFTIYLVFAYGIFIFVALIKVFANGQLHFTDQYTLFDPDFSTVAGAFALSFLLHPVGAPILKRNKVQANNMRDLLLGYGLTALIYVYVGFIGGLTCASRAREVQTSSQYSTIFDCFPKGETSTQNVFYLFGKIVQFGIFIQNLSVMPILSFLTRKEFLEQFSSQERKKYAFHGYNISMIIFCFVTTFFEVDVTIVISLNGAIVGFFMAYAIPIATHLSCYHKKMSHEQKKERSDLLLSIQTDEQTMEQSLKCNQHPPRMLQKHMIIYGGLFVMGIAVACFKLYSLFSPKDQSTGDNRSFQDILLNIQR